MTSTVFLFPTIIFKHDVGTTEDKKGNNLDVTTHTFSYILESQGLLHTLFDCNLIWNYGVLAIVPITINI